MIRCITCNGYSNERKYCYQCYHKKLRSILLDKYKIESKKSKCFICAREIYHIGYCDECYNKNIPINPDIFAEQYFFSNIFKNENQNKDIPKNRHSSSKEITNYRVFKKDRNYIERADRIPNPSSNLIPTPNYLIYKKEDNNQIKFEKNNNKKNKIEYKSNNGTLVKSKSELMICNYFTKHNIKFEYEKPLRYSDYKKPLKPDFYIKKASISSNNSLISKLLDTFIIKDVYIEHFGGPNSSNLSEHLKYKDIMNYKIEIYKKMKITLICTYEEDLQDIEQNLYNKLTNYKKNEINYFKK